MPTGGIRTRTSGIMVPAFVAPTAAAYAGSGDVLSSVAYWGLRAYTLASIGSNVVDLINDGTPPVTQTFPSIAGGGLNATTIESLRTQNGGTQLFVDKLYDQVGTNHMVSVGTTRPQFVQNASPSGTKPVIRFVPASDTRLQNAPTTLTRAQPLGFYTVAKYVNNATEAWIMADNDSLILIRYRRSADNQASIFSGTANVDTTASDGNWHTVCATYNGASSAIAIDNGADTSGNAGTNAIAAGNGLQISGTAAAALFNGDGVEWSIVGAAIANVNAVALYNNQHAYWGY